MSIATLGVWSLGSFAGRRDGNAGWVEDAPAGLRRAP